MFDGDILIFPMAFNDLRVVQSCMTPENLPDGARFRVRVYMKLKNVGPGVVADHIQGILSTNNLVPVDL